MQQWPKTRRKHHTTQQALSHKAHRLLMTCWHWLWHSKVFLQIRRLLQYKDAGMQVCSKAVFLCS